MRPSLQNYIDSLTAMRHLCMSSFHNLEQAETQLAPIRESVTISVPELYPELYKPGMVLSDALLMVIKQSQHYRNTWIELDEALAAYQEALRNLPE